MYSIPILFPSKTELAEIGLPILSHILLEDTEEKNKENRSTNEQENSNWQ